MNKFLTSVLVLALFVNNTASAFSVDFGANTPVVEALRALGYKAGKNIVINGDLSGTVSVHLDDTDFDSALEAISMANNFSYEYLGDTVLIAPKQAMNNIETFKLKHIEPASAAKQLGLLVEDDDVVVNNDMHTVTVMGSTAELQRIRKQIDEIDNAQKQVTIKATVIELARNKARKMGLSYLSDVWTKDTSISGYNGFKFSVTGAHEETIGSGNVLARPSITTFDGKKASILMGDKVPVFTSTSDSNESDSDATMSVEYKEVGVKLEVIPRLNDEDKETITMVIKPSVSTISQWVESGNNKAPQISERSAETTLRVKSGETILLGGLLRDEEIKSIKKIPFLSKLPVLGELFKNRSIDKKNTEILIAITPTIIYDEDGRPQVEMQRTNHSLKQKLNELSLEAEVSNVSEETQNTYEEKNKVLQEEKDKLNEEITKQKEEILRLKQVNHKLKRELKACNETMTSVADKLSDKGGKKNE